MIKEFREFIMRGNVIDLAVGVVIGGAFTSIVTSIVNGVITPLVAIIIKLVTGNKDGKISGLQVAVFGETLDFGTIISAIITFLITAFVVFMIVKAFNKAKSLAEKPQEETIEAVEAESDEIQGYLKEIRDLLAEQNKPAN